MPPLRPRRSKAEKVGRRSARRPDRSAFLRLFQNEAGSFALAEYMCSSLHRHSSSLQAVLFKLSLHDITSRSRFFLTELIQLSDKAPHEGSQQDLAS